jgi:nicotinate-nucleotide adenylyltransferase
VQVALHARRQLGLERVVLMPAGSPPHKPAAADPGPQHRLRMCRLAVAGIAGLSVCELELVRGGPSYTVDTLDAMHASHPDAELTLIVGADTARTLPAWHEPARLLTLARLAVATRSGSDRASVLDAVASIDDGSHPAPQFLEMEAIELSSSMVRDRAARGLALAGLVPDAVAGYIAEQRLYAPAAVS